MLLAVETANDPQRVCVLGLGYVGLPTAAIMAVNGFDVTGVDLRSDVVEAINTGRLPLQEVGLKRVLQAAINSGRLRARQTPSPADLFVIAVPTPVRDDHTPDLSYVEQGAQSIVPHLARGNLVVLESTVPPGTTDGMLTRILSGSGLTPKEDFFVAHCPERVLPGRILAELVENDRVIGGIDEESGRRAAKVYRRIAEGKVFVTSAITAELVKLVENAYRDVNVAFANEIARVSREWGVDGSEVVRLANRHPRVSILRPGPGVGGHCIPVDPWFLIQTSPDLAHLMRAAREVNDAMPVWVADRAASALADIPDPKISVWGVAYKGNVDDARETPALKVIEALEARGIRFSLADPHVTRFPHPISTVDESVAGADCILLLTDHDEFTRLDPASVVGKMRTRIVFDTRDCLNAHRWREAGFRVIPL